MDKIVYKELSYRITGLCFRVQKDLGRFCRERQYADRLEELLKEEKVRYQREFEIRKLNSNSPKGNRVDFFIEDQLLLDAKAKPFITNEDYAQMQRYLRGANLKLGLIVNFKDTYLKPKRVLNSRHSHTHSHFSHRSSGFTLVEMIVAFGIFAVIMVMSVGSLLSIMQANYKAQTLKTVVNNLHFAFENMSRNLRMGRAYHCNAAVGDLRSTADCANDPASSIAVTARDGGLLLYRHHGRAIERSVDGGASFIPITAPEINVEQLQFFVDGSSPSDNRQPRVLLVASGSMQGRGKVISRFDIETMVSQRLLDVRP